MSSAPHAKGLGLLIRQRFGWLASGIALMLGAVGCAHASPVDAAVSRSYLVGWSRLIHYCSGGLCAKVGRQDMPQADRTSFRPLSERYATDRERAYYEGRELPGADPASLRVLGPDHAVDKHALYVRGFRVREADAATARYLPRHYVLDQNKVWYGEFDPYQRGYVLRELAGADPARFHLPVPSNDTLATDGRRLYQSDAEVPIALGPDFRLLEGRAGFMLALVSNGRLHLQIHGLDWPDGVGERQQGWLILPGPASLEGKGRWRLLNGRWLIVQQGNHWRLLRDGVRQLQELGGTVWYAVVDGQLWHAPGLQEKPLTEVAPASTDLKVLDPYYVLNGGRIYHQGLLVEGADAATFAIAPEGMFRNHIDATDRQWLYGKGKRIDTNDDAGRARHRRPG